MSNIQEYSYYGLDERFFDQDDNGTWWRVNTSTPWHGPCLSLAEAEDRRDIWMVNRSDTRADFLADNLAFSGE